MSLRIPFGIVCLWFGVAAAGSITAGSVMDGVTTRASAELERAVLQLEQGRQARADALAEQASVLNRIEREVFAQRQQLEDLRLAAAQRTQQHSQTQRELAGLELDYQAVVHAFQRITHTFERELSVSELDRYAALLKQGRSFRIGGGVASSGDREFPVQVVHAALARLQSQEGVVGFPGEAIAASGRPVPGTVLAIGPLQFFVSEDRSELGALFPGETLLPQLTLLESSQQRQLLAYRDGSAGELALDPTNGTVAMEALRSESLWTHLRKGGIWVWPIVASAILASVLGLVKGVQLYRVRMPAKGQIHELLDLYRSGRLSDALDAATRLPAPSCKLMEQALLHSSEAPELVEELIYEHLLGYQPSFERGLSAIALTAATAPLLGLLGTVTGMIHTFHMLERYGSGDATVLSGGISQALVTTELGLVVAIPALILHGLLSRRVHHLLSNLEKMVVIYVNGLRTPGSRSQSAH